MPIKLRSLGDREFVAEYLTSVNCFPLQFLFRNDQGEYLINLDQNLDDLSPGEKIALMKPITDTLRQPKVLAEIARAIEAIFPSIPAAVVSYSLDGKFRMNLDVDEIYHIIQYTERELTKIMPQITKAAKINTDSIRQELKQALEREVLVDSQVQQELEREILADTEVQQELEEIVYQPKAEYAPLTGNEENMVKELLRLQGVLKKLISINEPDIMAGQITLTENGIVLIKQDLDSKGYPY